jgi:hypothetical protein
MTNNGLSVNYQQARGKQWWVLQQLPHCELNTWIMINIDLLLQKSPFLPEIIVFHGLVRNVIFNGCRQLQMTVLQTTALLSHFVPLTKSLLHQFTRA